MIFITGSFRGVRPDRRVHFSGPTMVHNARVKLVATALNNLGVAAIIYGSSHQG